MNDEFYMRLALDEAWKYQLLTYPNPAVGAVVVKDGNVLSIEAHQKAGTSHAEVLALLGAYEKISGDKVDFDRSDASKAHEFLHTLPEGFFSDCDIYVTIEPCSHEGKTPSCASLLRDLEIERVVIGTQDPIDSHSGGASMLKNVTIGVLEQACQDLIEPFVIWQDRAFVLFKIAQTLNGRIGGGVITSEDSRRHVHRLRGVCERLVIGGNTVRTDRPTLDCRLSDDKAPDVTIFSKSLRFDTSIPLFRVPDRRVDITNYIRWERCKGIVLVEGGDRMLNNIQNHIDWHLTYIAPKLSTNELSYNIEQNLEFLHQEKIGVDTMVWSRQIGD